MFKKVAKQGVRHLVRQGTVDKGDHSNDSGGKGSNIVSEEAVASPEGRHY